MAVEEFTIKADLKPGDLVFWNSPATHVAIWVKNNNCSRSKMVPLELKDQFTDHHILEHIGGKNKFTIRALCLYKGFNAMVFLVKNMCLFYILCVIMNCRVFIFIIKGF